MARLVDAARQSLSRFLGERADRFASAVAPRLPWSWQRALLARLQQLHPDLASKRAIIKAEREAIRRIVAEAHGRVVQAGPFKGMILPDAVSWSDGDFVPKALGFYEAELSATIAAAIRRGHRAFIDVGCAEGYYAIGFARESPATTVFAFDIDPAAQEICRAAARENGVAERVVVGGEITPPALEALLRKHPGSFVLSDCEGYELELLDPARVPSLSSCDMLIECHDFIGANVVDTLARRFAETHRVTRIREGGRDPNLSPALQAMDGFRRWLAVCEFRPVTMEWLVCTRTDGGSHPLP